MVKLTVKDVISDVITDVITVLRVTQDTCSSRCCFVLLGYNTSRVTGAWAIIIIIIIMQRGGKQTGGAKWVNINDPLGPTCDAGNPPNNDHYSHVSERFTP